MLTHLSCIYGMFNSRTPIPCPRDDLILEVQCQSRLFGWILRHLNVTLMIHVTMNKHSNPFEPKIPLNCLMVENPAPHAACVSPMRRSSCTISMTPLLYLYQMPYLCTQNKC
ncbi:hypothetical protein GDO81_027419 [Engystomops pustulosus]|uniref:Uncharacterized protein n=1 Tax=Engystomops pustulosus TaxID=76066 RepID=A0AAV6Z848_ENGPU|nr:hypothetical protein GDO81_027419 [Engystomops pustulosus]